MQTIDTSKVSQEQIDACERITDLNRNEVFYLVESQSKPGTHYKVCYDRQRKCLRCLPHDGEACPASVKGLTCWHMKAAVAHADAYKQERAEQSQIEAYVRQGYSREEATRVVYAQPTQYTPLEVKRAEKVNQRQAFSLLRK